VNRSRLLVVLLLLLVPSLLSADAPGVYAITGGTVHPVSGPEIANGTVVIRNGLIEAIGANVSIPADATTIDAKGMHVYPGLIDAQTSAGFTSAAPRRGGPGAARPADTATPEPTADTLAVRTMRLSDDDADAKRATGVTTIVAAPSSGIFNGQSVVLNLGRGDLTSRVIKSPAALQISFTPRAAWTFPDSLMGVMAYLRQTFLDAQQYGESRAVYTRNPAGLQRPADNATLEALGPVLRREMPVVFIADSELMVRRAQTIAREFNLRYIIAGARQGYRMADAFRDVPVLVGVKWPAAPTSKDDREEQPLRMIRDRQLAPTTPAALAKAGVSFALVSGAAKTSEFLPGIRKAIENGLSADDALRAVTLWPARIYGVDRQLGTLERGKIANLVLTDQPIFAEKAKVRRVFVDGRELRVAASDDKKDDSASATAAPAGTAAAAASAVDGVWSLTIQSSQGNVSMSVTLRAEDGKLTGSYSGDRGNGSISGGTFDGTAVEFTINADGQSESEQSPWVFRGTVSGNAMNGSVATNLGTFQFSGSRSK
jgi:imidazolonepropionase-like amidohydrolase